MSIFDGLKIPKIIYEVDSKLNGHVRVVEVGQTRKIIVDNNIQSISPDSPSASKLIWGQVVDSLKKRAPDMKRVLILGLAGGTIAQLISRYFPGVEIVSVEWDPVMVDIAKRFFNVDAIPNHRIILDDALKVVIEPRQYDIVPMGFDVLIVDIFTGGDYPDLGKTGNFFSAIKTLVAPTGLIVFDRIYTEDYQEDVNLFIERLKEFFEDIDSEIVPGYTNSDNILIFGRV